MKSKIKIVSTMPHLPLEGSIDLTYRCNNRCLHCWLCVPEQEALLNGELTFEELRCIVDEARVMGCRYWSIAGGEPLLRPDFPEIFEYLTHKSTGYTLNTNGTLITPEIARLLTRKGTKMVALYGASAEVYDKITRNQGGFEMVMQGFEYLKEAGAGFIVQLIPLKANWHQWDQMIALAESLSSQWRVGASWLYLSANNSMERNREIQQQRLTPDKVIELDKPNLSYKEWLSDINDKSNLAASCENTCEVNDNRLFASCIEKGHEFHIDPYGKMTWCPYIKDSALRFDLRKVSFEETWEKLIPECADKIRGDAEWHNNCGSCANRNNCRWCASYAYIETGNYSSSIPYLCEVAEEARKFSQQWLEKHRRYFRIAGITVCLESDFDFDQIKFKDELTAFAVDGPGEDTITLRHFFSLPDLKDKDLGKELYSELPWVISRKDGSWFYQGIAPVNENNGLHQVAVFNSNHTRGTIYNHPWVKDYIIENCWESLSLMPTDQIWLSQLLADRNGLILHSSAAIIKEQGFIFVGHSDAGKSTIIEILKKERQENGLDVEILCDDRNIIRKWNDRWCVHGTWSHGDIADVSPSGAPLRAIFFLEQFGKNELILLTDHKLIWHHLLATMIRPMITALWWHKELDTLDQLVGNVPCYIMRFDKTGAIVSDLVRLTG